MEPDSQDTERVERVRRLEMMAFRAWPAPETERRPGWLLRFSGGYTKRASSINGMDPLAELTGEAIAALEAPYAQRGLPPIWRITPLAPTITDDVLAARGYLRIDDSLVQVAPIDDTRERDPAVGLAAQPSPAWLAAFAELQPVHTPHRQTMAHMLTAIAAPVCFATVDDGAGAVGFAIGVVDGDHLGVFDMLVAPAARRRGLARRILRRLCAWGHAQGARTAYLQVVASNTAARALYASHGFEPAYRYWYRVPPPPATADGP